MEVNGVHIKLKLYYFIKDLEKITFFKAQILVVLEFKAAL